MAVLPNKNPTLLDWAKAMDPDGKPAVIVEILGETNEILTDWTFIEGNLVTGHTTTIRAGIPQPTWRKMYGGVQPTKGTTVQVTDNTGMLHALSEVDVAVADLNGNTDTFRLSQDKAEIEGMMQEAAETLFYGNEKTEAEAFTGFSPRFNSLSADNADNILDAAGTGTDNRSIWLIVWGPELVHGIIPKGSIAGLQIEDLGKVLIQDASDGSNTGRMMAYVTSYRWDLGLSIPDWRFVVRICNIDASGLVNDAATGADLADLMFQAMELVPNLGRGRPAFYMSRLNRTFLRRQLSNARSMSTLEVKDVGGTRVTEFQGIPLRRCDALSADEARVV